MLCVFGPKETFCMGILHPPQTTSARCSLSFSTKNYSLSLLLAGDAAVNTIFMRGRSTANVSWRTESNLKCSSGDFFFFYFLYLTKKI